MRRSLFLATAGSMYALVSGAALATSQPRLAINLASDGTLGSRETQRFLDSLTGKILANHRFQVVDRRRLAAVIAEQGFSNSDYADPQTAAALGKIVGASRILHVEASLEIDDNTGQLVSDRQADVSASFQLVGVDTARIIAAGTAEGTGERRPNGNTSDRKIIDAAIDDCADDLAQQVGSA